jgi:hypothetical protein
MPGVSFLRPCWPSCRILVDVCPRPGCPRPLFKSAEVAPGRVSLAGVYVDSLSWLRSVASLSAWMGTSTWVLGWKVRSWGADPGGRVWALNSSALSFGEALTPGLCCGGAVVVSSVLGERIGSDRHAMDG